MNSDKLSVLGELNQEKTVVVLCVRDCENKMNSDKLSVLGELNQEKTVVVLCVRDYVRIK